MSPDPNLVWLTLGAVIVFGAAALYSDSLLDFVGRKRGLRPPHRSIALAFRVWFAVLAGAALWLLFAAPHGLLSRVHRP